MADELRNTTTGAGTASAGTQKRAPRNDVNGVPRTERLRRPADPNELLTHNQPPRRATQNRPADSERMGVPLQAVKKEDASSYTGGLAAEEAAAKQAKSRRNSDSFMPGAGYEGPTNAELMIEIRRNRYIMITVLVLVLIMLITFFGFGIYIYRTFQTYETQLQDAFETMEKIDDMVGKLQRTYQTYSGQIDDFFDVVSELKGYVETFKSLLGSLPKIQLPF